jgi:hypothetical protein
LPCSTSNGRELVPDLELEAACRDDPDIEALASHGSCAASDVPVLAWLRAGYPGLFEREDLTERLWLYELCHQVRQLCAPEVTSADATGGRGAPTRLCGASARCRPRPWPCRSGHSEVRME